MLKTWFRILVSAFPDSRVFNGAAALAFYLTLAIFPAMIFLLTLVPYLPLPHMDQTLKELVNQMLPQDAAALLYRVVRETVIKGHRGLMSVGALTTLWASSSGTLAMMHQLRLMSRRKEDRSFLELFLTGFGLTLVMGTLILVGFGLIIIGHSLESWLSLAEVSIFPFRILKWLIVVGGFLLVLETVYFFGPGRQTKFRWVSPGSLVGSLLLIIASLALKLFISHFGYYSATYGSLAAMIFLMLALYIDGVVILFGYRINLLIRERNPPAEAPSDLDKS